MLVSCPQSMHLISSHICYFSVAKHPIVIKIKTNFKPCIYGWQARSKLLFTGTANNKNESTVLDFAHI